MNDNIELAAIRTLRPTVTVPPARFCISRNPLPPKRHPDTDQ